MFLRSLFFAGIFFYVRVAEACSVCFSNVKNDPMNVALRAAVLCMLFILLLVLMLFVKFFLSVRRRSKSLVKNIGV